MQERITIRQIISTDLDPVTKVYSESYNSTYISYSELGEGKAIAPGILSEQAVTIFREQLASLLSLSRPGLFVAISENNVVGFALACLRIAEAGHIECWLDDLGVLPNYRGQNIGEKLVRHILEWGTQQGAKYFLLESGVQNEVAHRLFARLGFHPLSMVFWRSAGH
jgi:ribosomal protein S18 acetylase RimI-like enzyme